MTARPVLPVVGPKYGPKVRDIQQGLHAGQFTVLPDGAVEVAGLVLPPEEVELGQQPKEGYAVCEQEGYLAGLDTRLTDDLLTEGHARELVHRIQTMRKEANFDIADRIITFVQGDAALMPVLTATRDYIKAETLSTGVLWGTPDGPAHIWSGEVDGMAASISVVRASTADTNPWWETYEYEDAGEGLDEL